MKSHTHLSKPGHRHSFSVFVLYCKRRQTLTYKLCLHFHDRAALDSGYLGHLSAEPQTHRYKIMVLRYYIMRRCILWMRNYSERASERARERENYIVIGGYKQDKHSGHSKFSNIRRENRGTQRGEKEINTTFAVQFIKGTQCLSEWGSD